MFCQNSLHINYLCTNKFKICNAGGSDFAAVTVTRACDGSERAPSSAALLGVAICLRFPQLAVHNIFADMAICLKRFGHFIQSPQTRPESCKHSGRGRLQTSALVYLTGKVKPTSRKHDPNEVHEKVVEPKIISLRPAILYIVVVEVEHGCGVVQDIAIDLTEANNELQRVAKGMRLGNVEGDDVAHWPPAGQL